MKYLLGVLCVFFLAGCDMRSSQDLVDEAMALEAAGDFEAAIKLLDLALEKNPKNIYALLNRGVDKSMLDDPIGASLDYSRVIELDPDNALAYLNRGKNKKRLDDPRGAIDDFNAAIDTKGGEVIYIDKVDNSLFDTGAEFDVMMEEVRFERGLAWLMIDSLSPALADFNFAIAKQYDLANSYYFRGIILASAGNLEQGCSDLRMSQQLGDRDAWEMIERFCEAGG